MAQRNSYNRLDYRTALPQLEKRIEAVGEKCGERIEDLEIIKEVEPTITATTGSLVEAKAIKNGNFVQLFIKVKNSSSTSADSNLFIGTLSNYLPKIYVCSSALTVRGRVNEAGDITVRANQSVPANSEVYLSFTYITEE